MPRSSGSREPAATEPAPRHDQQNRCRAEAIPQQLDPRRFHRVHRSSIVNIDRVKEMRSHINGEYFLMLDSGHEIKLSRSYKDKVALLR